MKWKYSLPDLINLCWNYVLKYYMVPHNNIQVLHVNSLKSKKKIVGHYIPFVDFQEIC